MQNPFTHPLFRLKLLKALRILGMLLALALLYVALAGISIDASEYGKDISAKLGSVLGREVRFSGPLQLEISARPKLRLGGLHIANARGFGEDEFASVGEARLELDLWHLLLGHLQIELAGSEVRLHLQAHKDGRNNWTFKHEAPAPDTPQKSGDTGASRLLALLDIQRVSLQKLEVEYTGGDGKPHYFELKSLAAHIPSGKPVTLSLNGTVEKTFPYQLDFTGGTLDDLVDNEQPWPIDLSLNFLSSKLALKGGVTGNSGNLHFALATQNLNELERLLQTALPPIGKASIAGDVSYAPGSVKLTKLDGSMGNTALNGAIDFEYGGTRPRVQGQLSLPSLDTRPFMTGKPNEADAPSQSLAEMYRELAQASFDLRALKDADVDLTLRVGRWLNLPGNVHDAMLRVKLERGRLNMPVQATLADVKLAGAAHIDARRNPARFDIALGTHDSGIGNLAGLLLGMPDVRGHLDRFDLRIDARGNRGSALMDSLDVQLALERGKLSYGDQAHPVQLALDRFALELPSGKALHGEARGVLLDNAFSMSLSGASLTDILQETNAGIDFALQAGGANAEVHAMLQSPAENSGSEIAFTLKAPRSSEIASWLGLKPGADVPANIKGQFRTRRDGWQLSGFALQLGRSVLTADAQQVREQNRPVLKLQLNSELIDADELQALLPEKKATAPAQPAPAASSMIALPILPQGINLADADIAVRLKRIDTSSPFAVRDLSFDGRIRDGMMSASPFAAHVASTDFNGSILLDLRSQQPRADLRLNADALDIGKVLQRLDIARNIDARIDHLQLHLDLHSSQLGQLLAQSELSASFTGGTLDLHDANTKGTLRIALDSGELRSAPGAPVRLNLNGVVDKAPVSINIQTATATDLLDPKLSIPFQLDAATSGASIRLAGDVDRPFSQQDVELALDMKGSRFDNLNTLLHTSLPPWGPWSASGKFHMTASGYDVSALQLKVGSSQLDGRGKLDTKTTPPRLDIDLSAPTIQIDDFRFGSWSPEKSPPASNAQTGKDNTSTQQLLSRQMLQQQNAYLAVRVEQVLSGNDALGNGRLDAKLENGHADIGPVVVNTPGGSAMFRLNYEPNDTDVAFNLRAEAKHFDYGILARRIDKRSEMRGTFDLDVDVSARAKQLSELMRYGKGHIDFAVWPENMKSGLLDVWAVNVLMAILPAVDGTHESKVNCAIGQFTLQDGKLAHKRILVDTTRMRVFGRGSADFNTEQLQFRMKPRSKTPQFLSFAIPIEVSGSFNDFSVGVSAGDVLELTGDLITSVIWVPLQSAFGKTRPEDGRDVCKLK